MGLDDLKKSAEGMVDKAKEVFEEHRDDLKDEEKTDALLDRAAGAAKGLTGGKFDEKIDQAREAADRKLGEE